MTFKNVNFFVSNRNKNTQRIQTLTKNILLFLLSILLFSNISQSSHIVSADITYECLGNNSYKINLKFYRNCSGIPMGLFQIVNYNSVSCGGGGNLLMIPDTSVIHYYHKQHVTEELYQGLKFIFFLPQLHYQIIVPIGFLNLTNAVEVQILII
jgi:hypothetical protein